MRETAIEIVKWICANCGHDTKSMRHQQFRNGSTHIREECAKCASFVKWFKQDNTTFRQKLFKIVRDLACCESREQFSILKAQATQVVAEAQLRNRQPVNVPADADQLELVNGLGGYCKVIIDEVIDG